MGLQSPHAPNVRIPRLLPGLNVFGSVPRPGGIGCGSRAPCGGSRCLAPRLHSSERLPEHGATSGHVRLRNRSASACTVVEGIVGYM